MLALKLTVEENVDLKLAGQAPPGPCNGQYTGEKASICPTWKSDSVCRSNGGGLDLPSTMTSDASGKSDSCAMPRVTTSISLSVTRRTALHRPIPTIASATMTLALADVARQQAIREARAEAASQANAVAAVRRLGDALAAERAENARLREELAAMKARAIRAEGTVLRLTRH